jgi:iron(III) transport system ATP-binding protein
MTAIQIDQITKSFGSTRAVDDVSLDVQSGELFFLLGPSGCGKTTLLRIIAGFGRADGGTLRFDGRVVNDEPPRRRGIGMVFQNYALWPHLTVQDNVAFGLDVRGVSRADRQRAVGDALALVRLGELSDRRPTQLSGGQQQRVALARALVIRPAILLLDEPLSNLDARLRLEMREEIRRIHAETKITTLYVTHDQKEALSLADRIGLMNQGRLVQVGTPRELYLRPVNPFVAAFLGDINLIRGRVVEQWEQTVAVETGVGRLVGTPTAGPLPVGSAVECGIRPEAFRLLDGSPATGQALRGTIARNFFQGELRQLEVHVAGTRVSVLRLETASESFRVGDQVSLRAEPEDVSVFAAEQTS